MEVASKAFRDVVWIQNKFDWLCTLPYQHYETCACKLSQPSGKTTEFTIINLYCDGYQVIFILNEIWQQLFVLATTKIRETTPNLPAFGQYLCNEVLKES